MVTNAELVKISDNEYNCSVCGDFKVEILKRTDSLWRSVQSDFADHVRRRHSDEGLSPVKCGESS